MAWQMRLQVDFKVVPWNGVPLKAPNLILQTLDAGCQARVYSILGVLDSLSAAAFHACLRAPFPAADERDVEATRQRKKEGFNVFPASRGGGSKKQKI